MDKTKKSRKRIYEIILDAHGCDVSYIIRLLGKLYEPMLALRSDSAAGALH